MSKPIQEWASQGSGQPNTSYEKGVYFPYLAMLHNPQAVDPALAPDYAVDSRDWFGRDTADGNFNIVDLVFEASTEGAGSPFEAVTAYNPDSLLADIESALLLMEDSVEGLDSNVLLEAIDIAAQYVDELMGDTAIVDLVANYEARQNTSYARDVANLYAGLWEGGAIIGTQTFVAAALLKNERNREVSEYEKSLQVANQGQRAQLSSQLVSLAVDIALRKMQARQAYAGTRMDYAKMVTITKQDQMEKDLEYETRNATWDLDIIQYAQNALGAIYGAQTTPRTQTKGERLLAAVNSSISLGIQGGLALGNPGGGVALGAGNFITQLLLAPR